MKNEGHNKISKAKIRDRDRAEFDRMFLQYFVRLAKYAYRYVSNVEVAKDLTQTVFLNIWELNGSWNPKGSIKSYLYLAVKNQCLNHIKHEEVVDKWKEEKTKAESTVQADKWDESKRREMMVNAIRAAISQMPTKQREIFELSRDDGLTYKEIAEIKGISEKTVEGHMGRALLLLKEELSDWI